MGSATAAVMPQHELVRVLQGLTALNIDSVKGLRQAAGQFQNAALSRVFLSAADVRESLMRELQTTVASMGATLTESGTAAGKVHRWWMGIRGQIPEGDEYPMLAEADWGERAIRLRYEEAMEQFAGDPVHAMLERHHDGIRVTAEMISALRRSSAFA